MCIPVTINMKLIILSAVLYSTCTRERKRILQIGILHFSFKITEELDIYSMQHHFCLAFTRIKSIAAIFELIGNVIPQAKSSCGLDIVTLTYDFIFNDITVGKMRSLTPGIDFNMNITSLDEFGQSQIDTFYARIISAQNITVDQAYAQVSNNIIRVHGNDHKSTGKLTLESLTASISINIGLGSWICERW